MLDIRAYRAVRVTGPVTGSFSSAGSLALDSVLSVTVKLQRSPTRMGYLPAGSLVINDDAAARVWVSPSSSVGFQAGTPLDPKTTFRVTRDGEYWAAIDPSGTTDVQLYVSPFVDQWTPSPSAIAAEVLATGISVRDNPALIELQFNIAVPFTGIKHDVSRWQSYMMAIQYEAANAGPPANTGIVTLTWYDSGNISANVLYQQTIEINSINTTDCGRSLIQDRMYGPFMSISGDAGNGAASTMTYSILGSYRPSDGMRCREDAANNAAGMDTDNVRVFFQGNINAGQTIEQNVRLGTGLNTVYSAVGTAAFGGTATVSTFVYSPQLGTSFRFWQRIYNTANATNPDLVEMPRRALTLRIFNSDTITHFVIVTITQGEEG